MTRLGWAERKVEGLEFIAFMNNGEVPVCESKDVVKALLAEHKRAVRVVQKVLRAEHITFTNGQEREGYSNACRDILAALQKGRT